MQTGYRETPALSAGHWERSYEWAPRTHHPEWLRMNRKIDSRREPQSSRLDIGSRRVVSHKAGTEARHYNAGTEVRRNKGGAEARRFEQHCLLAFAFGSPFP